MPELQSAVDVFDGRAALELSDSYKPDVRSVAGIFIRVFTTLNLSIWYIIRYIIRPTTETIVITELDSIGLMV